MRMVGWEKKTGRWIELEVSSQSHTFLFWGRGMKVLKTNELGFENSLNCQRALRGRLKETSHFPYPQTQFPAFSYLQFMNSPHSAHGAWRHTKRKWFLGGSTNKQVNSGRSLEGLCWITVNIEFTDICGFWFLQRQQEYIPCRYQGMKHMTCFGCIYLKREKEKAYFAGKASDLFFFSVWFTNSLAESNGV